MSVLAEIAFPPLHIHGGGPDHPRLHRASSHTHCGRCRFTLGGGCAPCVFVVGRSQPLLDTCDGGEELSNHIVCSKQSRLSIKCGTVWLSESFQFDRSQEQHRKPQLRNIVKMKVFIAISLMLVGTALAQEAAGFHECFEKDSISCVQTTVRQWITVHSLCDKRIRTVTHENQ